MGESKMMHLEFSSKLSDLVELNSSFDKGTMRICYAGANRNGSYIAKETIERCANTIYNCPIVCRYDRDTNSIGEHDVDVVTDDDGDIRMVNVTQPVGTIPESSEYWWENVTEDDGSVHEYFCTEVLLWKRQEAYQKIKRDGITKQSMEINVIDGEMRDGKYVISDFEFSAFCLLGSAEPCFESAALMTFSTDAVKQQFSLLIEDFKKEFSLVQSSQEVHDSTITDDKGGIKLDEKIALMKKYGLTEEQLDFKLEDYSLEELEKKFIVAVGGDPAPDFTPAPEPSQPESVPESAPESAPEPEPTPDPVPEPEPQPEPTPEPSPEPVPEPAPEPAPDSGHSKFELSSQLAENIEIALHSETFRDRWGDEVPRYTMVDFDESIPMVYAYDRQDSWKLVGMTYSLSGDEVVIDFNSRKRKKFAIIDYSEGERDQEPIGTVVSQEIEKYALKYSELLAENTKLAQFKAGVEAATLAEEKNAVFEKFSKLDGEASFEDLKANAEKYTVDQIEEKCYAIVGRTQANFSLNDPKKKNVKVGIPKRDEKSDLPYNGIFEKYGIV